MAKKKTAIEIENSPNKSQASFAHVHQLLIQIRNIYNVRVNAGNAKQVVNLFEQYGKALSAMTTSLTKYQKDILEKLFPEFERKQFKKEAQDCLRKELAKQQQFELEKQARASLVEESLAQVKQLFPELEKAANDIFAANFYNMDDLITNYKAIRSDIDHNLRNLPKDPKVSGKYFTTLNALSRKVNEHEEKLNKQLADLIRQAVTMAKQETDKMTVMQLLLAIAPSLTQQEILRLLESKSVLALNLLLPGGDNNQNALVLANLSLSSLPLSQQTALVIALLGELGVVEGNGNSNGLVTGFAQAIVADFTALCQGKKSHLSIMADVNGVFTSIHIDIRALLNDPVGVISDLTFQMFKMGVRDNGIVMKLSSPNEVAALMQLEGLQMKSLGRLGNLAQITHVVYHCANNLLALAQITGRPVTDQALMKVNQDLAKYQGKPFTAAEALALLKAIVIIAKTHEILTTGQLKRISVLPLEGVDELNRIQFAPIQAIEPAPAICAVPNKKPVKKIDGKYKVQYEVFMNELALLKDSISKKYPVINNKSNELRDAMTSLYLDLQAAGDDFFEDDEHGQTPTSFRKFIAACDKSIKKAVPVFATHRGDWALLNPILKGILGLLAMISIIPAIVVAVGSTHGFNQTFFGDPPTESYTKLSKLGEVLDDQIKDINDEMSSIYPGANVGA